ETANQRYAEGGWQGMTLAHVQFLSEVDEAGSRLSDIGASLGTTKQYAGKLAKEAAVAQLVSLEPHPHDGRAVLVRPTQRGRDFLEAACAVRRDLEIEFFRDFSESERKLFLALLDRILTRG
ncbi:MAG TPA: MarR family winged helix-turn-helix transcriptional regulator, partial [Rectinemataceae bacterium]|nr:MarR family winged helix-turn-helix transcriptional regulator [Rectinemataceae bacterium]